MVLSRSWQVGTVCYDREHRQRMIGTVWPGLNKCYWRKYETAFSTSKWQPFWKCQNIKQNFNLTSNMRRSSQIMPEKEFCVVMSSMTSQGDLKVALYSCLGEVGSGSKLQGRMPWTAQLGCPVLKASGRVQYSPVGLGDKSPMITGQHTAGGSVSQLTKLSPWLTLSTKEITTSFWHYNKWFWFYLIILWVYIISLTQ